jgi:hypothetical protein
MDSKHLVTLQFKDEKLECYRDLFRYCKCNIENVDLTMFYRDDFTTALYLMEVNKKGKCVYNEILNTLQYEYMEEYDYSACYYAFLMIVLDNKYTTRGTFRLGNEGKYIPCFYDQTINIKTSPGFVDANASGCDAVIQIVFDEDNKFIMQKLLSDEEQFTYRTSTDLYKYHTFDMTFDQETICLEIFYDKNNKMQLYNSSDLIIWDGFDDIKCIDGITQIPKYFTRRCEFLLSQKECSDYKDMLVANIYKHKLQQAYYECYESKFNETLSYLNYYQVIPQNFEQIFEQFMMFLYDQFHYEPQFHRFPMIKRLLDQQNYTYYEQCTQITDDFKFVKNIYINYYAITQRLDDIYYNYNLELFEVTNEGDIVFYCPETICENSKVLILFNLKE